METAERTNGEGPRSTPPPPGDRVAVVVNGNAKSVTDEVISKLDQILLGSDLFVSRRIEEGPELARLLVARGYGTVLTGGGDGTFTSMVTEVAKEAKQQGKPLPRFGFLKLGTGNALAWVVGASRARKGKGLAADIERLKDDAGSREVRLVETEGVMTPFCGCGVDAVVLQDYEAVKKRLQNTPLRRWASGPVAYAVSATTRSIPSYFIRELPHCRIINDGADAFRVGEQGNLRGQPIPQGEIIYEGPAQLAGVSTIPYYGFGLRAFPYAEERSDRMHLRISTIRPLPFILNFRSIWKGDYANPSYMFDYLVEKITMEFDPPTPFQIGGDPRGVRSRVTAILSPTPIRVVDYYAPPSAR